MSLCLKRQDGSSTMSWRERHVRPARPPHLVKPFESGFTTLTNRVLMGAMQKALLSPTRRLCRALRSFLGVPAFARLPGRGRVFPGWRKVLLPWRACHLRQRQEGLSHVEPCGATAWGDSTVLAVSAAWAIFERWWRSRRPSASCCVTADRAQLGEDGHGLAACQYQLVVRVPHVHGLE